jgi:hypothetical protein
MHRYINIASLGEIDMKKENTDSYVEIKEMLKLVLEDNKRIIEHLNELKEEQKRIQEEIRIQNIVLNSLPIRTEIIN